jgi:hypothetical protein
MSLYDLPGLYHIRRPSVQIPSGIVGIWSNKTGVGKILYCSQTRRSSKPAIAHAVEGMCDVASEWDKKYFRAKGLVMRLDMPGEEKFGLRFMDLFETHHTYNVARK